MTPSRFILNCLNKALETCNLRIDSMTAERKEQERLAKVERAGTLTEPVFPLPESFRAAGYEAILADLPKYQDRFETFRAADANDVGFAYGNTYFEASDAEVLYAVVRMRKPRRITEIGCGHSTRVIRQALRDGEIACHHLCIDPEPRVEITKFADEIRCEQVEFIDPQEIADPLEAGDVLFIDTSHEVTPANDVAYLFGRLLPRLGAGVLVHVHDIFLPYDYPSFFVYGNGATWGEQYVVQAMIANNPTWDVLWPGYYLQQTDRDFSRHFPRLGEKRAQSLWLEKTR